MRFVHSSSRVLLCVALWASSMPAHSENALPVTPQRVLEVAMAGKPDVAVVGNPQWTDSGRAVVLTIPQGGPSTIDDDSDDYDLGVTSIDIATGRETLLGRGYRPSAATLGKTVGYFVSGSRARKIAIVADGRSTGCTVDALKVDKAASRVQAISVSADGAHVALVLERSDRESLSLLDRASNADSLVSTGDGPRVKVLGTAAAAPAPRTATIWIADHHCGSFQETASLANAHVGNIAWNPGQRSLVALAAFSVPGRLSPRTDLVLIDRVNPTLQTLMRDIGGQAGLSDEIVVSPSGRRIAFAYDGERIPYRIRKTFAIFDRAQNALIHVSGDPFIASQWFDEQTLLTTRLGGHPLVAQPIFLGPAGEVKGTGEPDGAVTLSPTGKHAAQLETDLYGNSTLYVGTLQRTKLRWSVKEKRSIWNRASGLSAFARARREMVACDSADGVRPLAIVVYPRNHDPSKSYPLLVDIHGGPQGGLRGVDTPYASGAITSRTTLEHDMWAARGYVVLVPDYRASGQYGYDRLSRDGDAFQDDYKDIMCAVDRLVESKLADPQRMAVIGMSYGAMQVNWLVTHTKRFAAAISYEGPWNLDFGIAWGERGSPNVNSGTRFGSALERPEVYERMSVRHSVKGVRTPTMFVETVPSGVTMPHYGWMLSAWQAQGIDAQLRIYDEKRHALTRSADLADLLNAAIEWVDKYTKPRMQTPQ